MTMGRNQGQHAELGISILFACFDPGNGPRTRLDALESNVSDVTGRVVKVGFGGVFFRSNV